MSNNAGVNDPEQVRRRLLATNAFYVAYGRAFREQSRRSRHLVSRIPPDATHPSRQTALRLVELLGRVSSELEQCHGVLHQMRQLWVRRRPEQTTAEVMAIVRSREDLVVEVFARLWSLQHAVGELDAAVTGASSPTPIRLPPPSSPPS